MKPQIEAKHKRLKERYKSLYDNGLRNDVIYETLAKEFFYSPSTVQAILYGTAHYHKSKQKKV